MTREELLERHFRPRDFLIRWSARRWRVWSLVASRALPPLAVLLPEHATPLVHPPRPRPELEELLEEEPALFETPSFGELVGAAGDVAWDDEPAERLVMSADRVFNLALLARGLAVVEPRAGAVAFDVVRAPRGGLSVMRVHTSTWAVLLACTTHAYAPVLTFEGGARRVA